MEEASSGTETTIYIPIEGSSDVIAVTLGPGHATDPGDVVDCLQAEVAPLALWLDFVKAYLAAGQGNHAEYVLREGTSAETEAHFAAKPEGERCVAERVQLLCAAAAFQTQRAVHHTDRGARNEGFAKAAGLLGQARALDHREQLPSLGNAQVALAQGNIKQATTHLEQAAKLRCIGQVSIAPLVGLATLAFNDGRYDQALSLFRQALRLHPGAPPALRVALGVSAFKLGKLEVARKAFRRATALDPSCVAALTALAVLELHGTPSAAKLTGALHMLCRAYSLAPHSPVVLNLLAHHCLLRGDYHKVAALASAALQGGEAPSVRAASETLLGRAAHAQNELMEAYGHYRNAMALDKRQAIAQYGMAQLSLLQGPREVVNAVSLLEAALDTAPAWPDALKMLGEVYPALEGRRSAAVKKFSEATANQGATSPDAWHILAELLSFSDPGGALKAYDKALYLFREAAKVEPTTTAATLANGSNAPAAAGAGLPVKLLNNAAVLHMRLGNLATAMPLMQEAVRASEGGAVAMRLTIGFNMARMKESDGDLQAASREYQAMLDTFPDYIDCRIRLAAIAAHRGDRSAATDHLDAALQLQPRHGDALASKGQLLMAGKDYEEASEVFTQLVSQSESRSDAYGRLGLATLAFAAIPSDSHKEEVKAKRKGRLTVALQKYKELLDRHPGNIFAANGVGAVLAEMGALQAAKAVFTEVQEAASGEGAARLPDVWANAGATALGLQDASGAALQWAAANRRFHGGRDTKLMLWLARANYDGDNLEAARTWLLKAMHISPAHPTLRFNIATTMQQAAVRALRREFAAGEDAEKLDAYEQAVMGLKASYDTFNHLKRMPPARSGIDTKKLDAHITFCADTYNKAQVYVERARNERTTLLSQRKQQELKLVAEAAVKEAKAKREIAAAVAAKKVKEVRAMEAREKLERLKSSWKESQALQVAASAGDSTQIRKKKDKAAAAAELDAMFEDEDDDGDYDPSAPDPLAEDPSGAAMTGAEQELADAEAVSEASSPEEDGSNGGRPTKKQRKSAAKAAKGGSKSKAAAKAVKGGKSGGSGPSPSPSPLKSTAAPGGRLKRRRASSEDAEEAEATPAEALEDLEDDADEASPHAAGMDGATRRAHTSALLEDSDDEKGSVPVHDADSADDLPAAALPAAAASEHEPEHDMPEPVASPPAAEGDGPGTVAVGEAAEAEAEAEAGAAAADAFEAAGGADALFGSSDEDSGDAQPGEVAAASGDEDSHMQEAFHPSDEGDGREAGVNEDATMEDLFGGDSD